MFEWNEDTVRFRIDAAEEVGFDARIASRIIPHIGREYRLCDAGAGLGFLSFALAPHCAHITAVEENGQAFQTLTALLENRGLSNVSPKKCDLFSDSPKTPYDAMVFCFFGGVKETLAAVKKQCSGKAFLIKRAHSKRRFSIEETPHPRLSFQAAEAELRLLQIPYEAEVFDVDMGQPFASLKDAQLFFRIYAQKGSRHREEDVLKRLERTASARFPYYLPAKRPLGMIILHAKDIPDAYGREG